MGKSFSSIEKYYTLLFFLFLHFFLADLLGADLLADLVNEIIQRLLALVACETASHGYLSLIHILSHRIVYQSNLPITSGQDQLPILPGPFAGAFQPLFLADSPACLKLVCLRLVLQGIVIVGIKRDTFRRVHIRKLPGRMIGQMCIRDRNRFLDTLSSPDTEQKLQQLL